MQAIGKNVKPAFKSVNGRSLSRMRRIIKIFPLHAALEGVIAIGANLDLFSQRRKMAAERSYDAVVIGAGQGAKPLSIVLARAGP